MHTKKLMDLVREDTHLAREIAKLQIRRKRLTDQMFEILKARSDAMAVNGMTYTVSAETKTEEEAPKPTRRRRVSKEKKDAVLAFLKKQKEPVTLTEVTKGVEGGFHTVKRAVASLKRSGAIRDTLVEFTDARGGKRTSQCYELSR